jgi:hypothetical protein
MYSRFLFPFRCLVALAASLLFLIGCGTKEASDSSAKPVFLYSNYYNAEGENRYPADGVFSEFMDLVGQDFEVRVNADPLTAKTLSDVKVLLIANPNDKAVEGFPAPHHVTDADIKTLTTFVTNGGGLITTHNQENHNLETVQMNRLLGRFGLTITDDYTDAKAIRIPKEAPIIGGLLWAYIIGDSVQINSSHPAKPHSIVTNDLSQKPLKGERNAKGSLLAAAEPGKGRVLVITDSGWILNAVFHEEEAGGVVIKDHDNIEIARRLTRWVGGL